MIGLTLALTDKRPSNNLYYSIQMDGAQMSVCGQMLTRQMLTR